jgi:hypothetical protein
MIADEKIGEEGVRVRCKKCGNIMLVTLDMDSEDRDLDSPVDDQESRTDSLEQEDSASQGDEEFSLDDESLENDLDGIFGTGGPGDDSDEHESDPFDRQSTRVFSMEEMQKVEEEKEKAGLEPDQEQLSDLQDSETSQDDLASLDDDEDDLFEEESVEASQEISHDMPQDAPPKTSDDSGEKTTEQDSAQHMSDDDLDGSPTEEQKEEKPEWYAAASDEQVGPMTISSLIEGFRQGEFDAESLIWKAGFEDWIMASEVDQLRHLFEEEDHYSSEDSDEYLDDDEDSDTERESFDDEPKTMIASHDDLLKWESENSAGDIENSAEENLYSDEEDHPEAESKESVGQDVEWKPSAISNLSALAEEELASMALAEQEDEEEDALPFDDADQDSSEAQPDLSGETFGESSLIAQIAAEEEAAAKRAEEEKQEEERAAALALEKEKEEALQAQEAARKEMEEEQRRRAAHRSESALPAQTGVPRWVIFVGGGGGALIIVLLGFIVYMLASGTTEAPKEPTEAKAAAQDVAVTKPVVASADAVKPSEPAKAAKAEEEVAKTATPETKTDTPTAEEKKPKEEVASKSTKTSSRKKKSSSKKKSRDRKVASTTSPPPKVTPKVERRVSRKKKGGLLDFEDDAAFASETGQKPKAVEKPKQKELPPLGNAAVLGVMRQHIAEFKACNKKQQAIDSSVKGKMIVDITISNSGKVSKARVTTSQFRGTFVSTCITKVIKQLKFPKFGGSPTKKVPFPFTVK